MIVGYLVTYTYIFFLIFVLGPLAKKLFNGDVSRKLIHILLFMVWFFIDIFFKNTIHQIIIPVSFLIINALSYKFKIFKAIEKEEDNHLGTIYFAITVTILMTIVYFVPSLYFYSGVGVICLTLGDGLAALLGTQIKSKKIYKKKSLIGFIGCIVGTFIGLLIFKLTLFNNLKIIYIILLSFVVGIVELVDYGLDNFTVSLIPFGIGFLLNLGVNDNLLTYSLCSSIVIFFFIYFSKSITYYGSLMSMIIVFVFGFFGGYKASIFLIISYLISFFISVYRKLYFKRKNIIKERNPRGFVQIFVNGFGGALCCILSYFIDEKYLVIACLGIGGCLIDSISSDIGRLSKYDPFDFIKGKRVKKGLSGGVSVLGLISSLIGAIFLSGLIVILSKQKLIYFIIYIPLLLIGTLVDTILGSIVQVKYQCVVCQEITEKREHCNSETKYYSGIKFIDNNMVNLLASLIMIIICRLVLI